MALVEELNRTSSQADAEARSEYRAILERERAGASLSSDAHVLTELLPVLGKTVADFKADLVKYSQYLDAKESYDAIVPTPAAEVAEKARLIQVAGEELKAAQKKLFDAQAALNDANGWQTRRQWAAMALQDAEKAAASILGYAPPTPQGPVVRSAGPR